MSSSNNTSSSSALFEELEPRLLLSADSLGGLDALVSSDERELGDTAAQMLPAYQEFTPLQANAATPSSSEVADRRQEMVFVDGGIEDYETLVAGFLAADSDQRGIQVVVLDPDRDGIEQITSALAGQTGLDAVHVVSHGDDASLRLGNTTLNGKTVERYQAAIAGWAGALDAKADLLFYGCNLAASEDGRALVDRFSELTGADVAASEDLTGHVSLGGDWDLEYTAGTVETAVAASASMQSDYQHVMATFTVSTSADAGAGSLRQAIIDANTNANPGSTDSIVFDIGADGSQQTINLLSALDPIDQAVFIDGFSQYGALTPDVPLIEINGASTTGEDGLVLAAGSDGSTISGLVVNRFDNVGIKLLNSNNHTIVGNYIGTDLSGTLNRGNGNKGLQIENSASNQIGGPAVTQRNVISGNGNDGIILWGAGSTLNTIQGNYIGVDVTGDTPLANLGDGISIAGGANDNTIGGDRTAGEGNVLSGNNVGSSDGIEIDNVGADNNKIYGNYIGTNHDGTATVANARHGVVIYDGVQGTLIGDTGTGQGNIISGNGDSGIIIDGNGKTSTTNNVIAGNLIGVDVTGILDFGNVADGVYIFGSAAGNLIGGFNAGEGNVIAFNGERGVRTLDSGTGNQIVGNTITQNAWSGIHSFASGTEIVGNVVYSNGTGGAFDEVVLGASQIVYHNTIHGSADDGISVEGANAIIRNNIITGSAAYGIRISGGSIAQESHNLITDAGTAPGNLGGRASFALDVSDLNADPLYLDAANGDFRLTDPGSPAIDAGVDLGGSQPDVNGAGGGLYDGTAPDMGVFESWAPVVSTATFQQGVNGYTGTQDTFVDQLDEFNPAADHGNENTIDVDLDDGGGNTASGLIRFDDLFGSGPGQIPFGSTIDYASLSVYVTNASDAGTQITMHQMLIDWNESSNWDSTGSGVQTDNTDAASAVASLLGDPDVTGAQAFTGLESTLQAWSDGSANYGWVIITDDNNGLDFSSSEEAVVIQRPKLTISYTLNETLLVSTTGNTVLFTEDAGATTALFTAAMDTVESGDTVTQVILTLANVEAGDTLLFGGTSVDLNTDAATGPDANGFTYTVSSAGASPVVTISHAGATDTQTNTMLNSLVFNNTANNDPGTTARTVTLTSVTDSGSGLTNDGTVATVNVAKADDALVVSTTGNTVLFTEDAGATSALFAAAMDTVETGDAVTQVVLTLANIEAGDTLTFGATSVDLNTNAATGPDANGFTYTVSSAGATPVVTISHTGASDTLTNTMLNNLVFNNTANDYPSNTARTVTLTSVTDSGTGLTADGTVATVNVASVIEITARETVDDDADGQIDHIRITTDQNLNDDFSGLVVNVDGYTVIGYVTNISAGGANDNVFYAQLTESGAPDSGATPTVTLTANTSLGDGAGNNIDVRWWDTDWQSRHQITFDNTNSSEHLIDFPVLLRLTPSDLDFDKVKAGGADIRFVDVDGTPLDYEIESWDDTPGSESATVWVRVPQLDAGSNSDFIWIYHDNAGASDAQNAAGVWNANHIGVWHLGEDVVDEQSVATHFDSTGANDGTQSGNVESAGAIGDGQVFDGDNDFIDLGSSAGLTDIFSGGGTVSAWINPTSWGENGYGRIFDKTDSTIPSAGWALELAQSGQQLLFQQGFSGSIGSWYSDNLSISLGAWQQVTVTYDASSPTNVPLFYIDGVLVSRNVEVTPTGTMVGDAGLDLHLGNFSGATTRTFDGSIDEARISAGVRSADWIEASFLSQNGAFSFASFGAKENPGVVATDKAAAVLLSRETADLDSDGSIDALHLTFSEAVSDASVEASDFSVTVPAVTGLAFNPTANGDTADDTDIYLTFDDAVHDTGVTPSLAYTQSGGTDLEDLAAAPNKTANIASGVTADKAGPVLLSATAIDGGVAGLFDHTFDRLDLVFSESISALPTEGDSETNFVFSGVDGDNLPTEVGGDTIISLGTTSVANDTISYTFSAGDTANVNPITPDSSTIDVNVGGLVADSIEDAAGNDLVDTGTGLPLTVTASNSPLLVATTGNTVLFTEDAGATTALFAASMDTVEAGDTVTQIVLTLANVEAGDTVVFGATSVDLNTNTATGPDANGFTFTVSSAGATPVVTITHAGATDTLTNTMLNSLVFNNTANNDPGTTARTVTLTSVTDSGSGLTNDGTVATVNVAKADDALLASTTGNTVLFTEDAGATTALFAASMDTVESGDTVTQVILTLANVEAGDTLVFGATSVDLNTNAATGPDANGFTYTVSSAGTTPVVTISHVGASDTQTNTMLNSLVFNNTTNNDPSTTARTVTLTSVTDSGSGLTNDGTVATVNVAIVDDLISVGTTGNTVLFTESAGATSPLFAASMDTVEAGDSVTQVVLTLANVEAGDTLVFGATSVDLNINAASGPDANGFTYTVTSAGATPVVAITHAGASDTLTNSMLNSLVFNNTTNNDPSTTARTVTLNSVTDTGSGQINDGTVATVNIANTAGATETTSFQQGAAGYTGTEDTHLKESDSANAFGTVTSVSIDLDDGSGQVQGLIRFDNLFGSGPGQIPIGATIISASLTVEVFDPGSPSANVTLHEMLTNWSEASTWDSLTTGLQSGSEYTAAADSTLPAPETLGTNTFSGLASTLQAWSNGGTNLGWAILNSSAEGMDFYSSEHATASLRPKLNVVFASGATITSDGGGDTASINVAEGTTAVTTVTATDPQNDPVIFSISGGADATKFDIVGGVLTFKVAPDFETPTDTGLDNVYEVEVTAADGISAPDTQLISVRVTNVDDPGQNDAPENTVPGAQTIDRDGALVFTSANGTEISIDDVDAGSNLLEVTLIATNGTVNLSGDAGLVFSVGDGTADTSMTFTGTVANINAALEGATFIATPAFSGSANVQITTDDQGNSGPGGPLNDVDNIAIMVRESNLSVWSSGKNNSAVGATHGSLTWHKGEVVALTDPNLSLGTNTDGRFVSKLDFNTLPGDGDVNITGLHYVSRDTVIGSANSVTVQAGDVLFTADADEVLGGVSIAKSDIALFRPDTLGDYSSGTFSVIAQDAVPSGDKIYGFTLVETATTVGGTLLNAGEFLLVSENDKSDIQRYTPGDLAIPGGGTTTLLVDGSDVGIGKDITSLHLVSSNATVGGLALNTGQIVLNLAANDNVGNNALPVEKYDAFALSVSQTEIDGTPGTSAATASFVLDGSDVDLSSGGEEFDALTFVNENLAPTVADIDFDVDENSANATVVGTVAATDPEGSPLTYAITAGNTDGAFTINASTGQITVANSVALDFETTPSFDITVAAVDEEGAYGTEVVTITLNDINEIDVATTGNTVLFTEDAGATGSLFTAAIDSVESGDTMTQVVLTLANVEAGDTLVFGATSVDLNTNAATGPDANGFTYTVSSAGTTPVVTISHAGATDTQTNTMLNSLVFNNTANNDPGATARTVTLTSVTESGFGLTNDGTVATVNVAKADDALAVSTTGNTVLFTEDAGATTALFTAGVDTVESGDVVTQVVLTLANVEAGDTLVFGANSVDLNTNAATGPDGNGFTYTVSSAGTTPVVTISHAGATDTLTNTMLNSLVFNNTANNDPGTTARTVILTSVTDSGSGLTNDGTVATVNVAKADDALAVSTTGNTVLFTEDAGATTALFAASMDTVETGDTVTQVVLTLANVEAGDTLFFGATSVDLNTNAATGPDANGFTYTVSSAGTTPVVTISHAGATDTLTNTMLNSLVFNNTSNDDPSTTARTVTLTSVTDSGSGLTNDGTVATVNVALDDDALSVSTNGNTVLFTEDAGVTTALFAASMDTIETGDTVTQVILTLANVEAGDTLLFGATSVDLNTNGATGPDGNGFTYTVSSAGATPVVTISHAGATDTLTNTMLNSLVFNNTANNDPSTTARTVTLTSVTDSGSGLTNDGTVATVNVAKTNDALNVATTGNTVLFTEDAGATSALFAASMDTVETGDTVAQVILTLANVEAGDTLVFGATSVDLNTNAATGPDGNGFTYTVSSAGTTPVVTISHAGATDTQTNTMLNSLVFNNTANNDPGATARTVTLTSVTDSGSGLTNDGTVATVNVAKADDALVVSTTGNTVLFTEDAGATSALFAASMDTVETGDTVTQVILTLANVEAGDTLLFGATSVDLNTNAATGPDGNGFTYTVSSAGSTPMVTISHAGATDTLTNTMLNSLVFNNTTNNDPSTTARTVTLTSVTDSGSGLTNDGTAATVNVAKADDALNVATTGNTVLFTEDAGATSALFAASMDTVETGDTVTQVILTLANVEAGDTLVFGATSVDLNTNAATGPDGNGFTYTVSSAGATPVVTISHAGATDTLTNTMLNSLVFNNTTNNDPSTTARTVTLTSVTDSGSGLTNDGTVATVNVAKADDALLVSTTGNTVLFTEDAGATTALFAASMDTVETGDTVTQVILTLANVEAGDTLVFGATSVDLNTNAATGPDANGFTYTVSSAGASPVVTISHAGATDTLTNTMLNSLVFNNTANNDPGTTARTVTLTSVTDSGSGLTNDGTVATVNVAKADDGLVVSTTGNTVLFTEDAGATTALFAASMDTVETGDTVTQVILTLANVEAGDTLVFGATSVDLNTNAATGPDGNGFTYTVSSAGATPVVTISHAGATDTLTNTMLNSLVFNNTTNNDPSTTARTVTLTSVTDSGSGLTNDGTVATVNVAKADDALLVSTTGNTVLFTEDAGATSALFAASMDTVETGDTVTQVILTLANVEAGDTLVFGATSVDLNTNAATGPDANGFTYTVSSAGASPVVTISHAGATDTLTNTMLNSLVFNNTANNDPGTTARTVTLTSVTDSGSGLTNDGTVATVNVAKADDGLAVSTTGNTVLFTEDAGATTALFAASMDTVETGDTVTQVILTLANVEAGDTLTFGATSIDLNTNAATGPDANGFTYTVSSAGASPVVTISHAGATDTQTNTMLNSLVFNNTANNDPSTTARTVTLTSVTDTGSGLTNDGTVATVNVAKADDPLAVSTTGNTVLFTEDAGATTALFAASMDTVETGDTVTQVILTLANVEAGDTLTFGATSIDLNTNAATGPDGNGFTYTVSSAGTTPVVTISHAGATDTLTNTMLNSLVFNNTANNDPSTTARTLTLTSVTDSGSGLTNDGTVATVNVAKADDPLVVSTTGNTVLFTEDAGASSALFAASMDTVEAGDTVTQVILTLANVEAGDTLTFGATSIDLNTNAATGPDANGFTYTVSSAGTTPVVTISHAGATDTLTNTMLNSLVFNNTTNNDPSTTARTVTLTSVTDSGSGLTNDGTVATVNVAKTNDAPTVNLINVVTSLPETTSTATAIKIADIVVTDVDAGTNNLTLAGADLAHFEIVGTELRLRAGTSLDFEIPADADMNHVFDVTVVVDDPGAGGTPDDTAATTLTVTDVNENPGGAGTLTTTNLNDDAGATNLFVGLTVSDPDTGENDLSVTITLTNPPAGTISGGGFTDLGGGVYQATGLSVAQADTALDNATFAPTDGTGPSGTFTTDITLTVNDQGGGGEQSVLSATTVTITRVNTAPSGLPGIFGVPVETLVLTATTDDISDADGLGTFSFQWLRDGVPIATAIDSSYTLVGEDRGTNIAVQVEFIDGNGATERVTSVAVGPVSEPPAPEPKPESEDLPPAADTLEKVDTPPPLDEVELSAVLPVTEDLVVAGNPQATQATPRGEPLIIEPQFLSQITQLLDAAAADSTSSAKSVARGPVPLVDAQFLLRDRVFEPMATETRPISDSSYESSARQALIAGVQDMQNTMAASGDSRIEAEEFRQTVIQGTLGTLSVGSVTWLLRAGSLLASVFSSIPMWSTMDPLPVLDVSAKERKRRLKATSNAGDDASEQRMDEILERGDRRSDSRDSAS